MAQVVLYSQIETLPGIGEVDVDVAADVGRTGVVHTHNMYAPGTGTVVVQV